jgi:hypothetical protein
MAMADTGPAQEPPVDPEDVETEVEAVAERRLVHDVVLGAVVAMPIGIVVSLGIVVLAVQFAGVPEGGPELMAVFVGMLFGLFFGALSGFVRNSAKLDDLDVHGTATPKPVARPDRRVLRSRILPGEPQEGRPRAVRPSKSGSRPPEIVGRERSAWRPVSRGSSLWELDRTTTSSSTCAPASRPRTSSRRWPGSASRP